VRLTAGRAEFRRPRSLCRGVALSSGSAGCATVWRSFVGTWVAYEWRRGACEPQEVQVRKQTDSDRERLPHESGLEGPKGGDGGREIVSRLFSYTAPGFGLQHGSLLSPRLCVYYLSIHLPTYHLSILTHQPTNRPNRPPINPLFTHARATTHIHTYAHTHVHGNKNFIALPPYGQSPEPFIIRPFFLCLCLHLSLRRSSFCPSRSTFLVRSL